MKIIHAAAQLQPAGKRVCLAIGFFDGVHLGHQQIIRQTLNDARQHEAIALVVTFDQHPNVVVAPGRVPALIYSLPQKLRTIESLKVDTAWLIHFDKAFSEQTGEEFVRSLARDLGPLQSICVGANFVFGRKRGGNVELLQRLGSELKFTVHGLAAVALDGQAVSSTRIRQSIQAGELDAASQMLGRAYSLSGQVLRGDGLGARLGFPTANLDVTGLALPPKGVYVVQVEVCGQTWRAVLNIGTRPTLRLQEPRLQVEAHLLGFSGQLYGQEMEVIFVDRLREEKKFDSLDGLRAQIAEDIREAQKRF